MGTSYQEYLESEDWKQKRKNKLSKQNYCEVCGIDKNLEVHHLVYGEDYNIKLSDLKVLCKYCHRLLHLLKDSGRDLRHENVKQEKINKIEDIITEKYKRLKILK